MTKRLLIPILFTICFMSEAFAQFPTTVQVETPVASFSGGSSVCPPGVVADAGTTTQMLDITAQSNDVEYLCFDDIINIAHQGGQSFGDPDAVSPPGISYHFYDCPPTVSGPDFTTMVTDPCILLNPANLNPYIVQSPNVDILGNASFTNNGALQNLFNAGAPVELFFAPVTIDDWANFIYETDGAGGDAGPCINLNASDNFRIVYLNTIEGTDINNAAAGSCSGSFTAVGGLPEFENNAIYTNITISLSTDPSVVATLPQPLNIEHGDLVSFSVPEPGIYNVLIEDGKSCAANFQIDMTNCESLNVTVADEVTTTGSNVCVPVSATNINDLFSFQFILEYDPAVLTFNNINLIGLPPTLSSSNLVPGEIIVSWLDDSFIGVTLADDSDLFEICFTAIGANGTNSDINITGTPPPGTPIEFSDVNGPLGQDITNGSVSISNASFALDFGICTSIAGNTDGSFTVFPTGGTAPFSLLWDEVGNPGNTGSSMDDPLMATGLSPGTYNVVVIDGNAEQVVTTVVIDDLPTLAIQTVPSDPTCPLGSDACIDLNTMGGIGVPDIIWSVPGGAPGSFQICNLVAAPNYGVTVTDEAGCVLSSAQSIFDPQPIIITTLNEQDITCAVGGETGSISVEASGGNGAPFTYSWTNTDTGANVGMTSDVSNLPAGNYQVSVQDVSLCSVVSPYTIDEPVLPTIQSFDSTSVVCPNDMSGSLTVNAIPGSGMNLTYQWDDDNAQTTQTAINLSAGDYMVTVSDDQGCTVEEAVSLFSSDPLTISMTLSPPSCANTDDGIISITIETGSNGIIEWFDGESTSFHGNLLCGEENRYTVMIMNPCDTIMIDTFLPCPPAVNVDLDLANIQGVNCNNGVPCDGQLTAIGSGGTTGTGLYTFTWSSGFSQTGVGSSTAMDLCQGEQFVIVSDLACDSDTTFFTIDAPDPMGIDITQTMSTKVSCFGDSDGSAIVFANGGTAPYTFEWVNPAVTGNTISGVPEGSYTVNIFDANGCTIPFTIEVGSPEILVAQVVPDSLNNGATQNLTCAGGADGSISVFANGGDPGAKTYLWSPQVADANQSTASGLTAGTYSVTIVDVNGCSDSLIYTLDEPEPIVAWIPQPGEPICNGYQTVVTIDSIAGGVDDLSYRFSVDFGPPQFPNASIPILAGEHTVQVFDGAGCSTEYTIFVDQPDPVTVRIEDDDGPDDGIIELELGDSLRLNTTIVAIDVPIDTLMWDPVTDMNCFPTASDTICQYPWVSPIETITYELTVIDTNGCVGSDEIIVEIDRNRNVFIPNAFSPDGNGINDLLKVYTGAGVDNINYFRIYDRWGEQVYENIDFNPGANSQDGWDGRLNGKIMNGGIYAFIAEVRFVDGRVLLYRGDITLLR